MYPYIKASVCTIDSASGRDGDIDSVLFLLALRHRALISAENGGKDVYVCNGSSGLHLN